MPLTAQQVGEVRDALWGSHRDLAAFAQTIPPAEQTRRSYCTDWSVAQVYSHLGSGAEIGLANLRAALAGTPPADQREIWRRWDALTPDRMITGFILADARYLDAVDQLDPGVADLSVQLDAQFRLPIDVVMVMRLTEHALHSWDIHVAFDPDAELDPRTADLLVELYPREVMSMVATRQVAGRVRSARLRIDIGAAPRTQALTFADSVTLETTDPDDQQGCTGRLRLPTSAAWARLATGRLDDEHMPAGVTSTGTPTLDDLRTLLQGDPFSTGDATGPP
jgi:uncharacterized protein (TIGR03083 family)